MSRDIFSNFKRDMFSLFNTIGVSDSKYEYVRLNLINKIYPNLKEEDKILLTDAVVIIINFIVVKFSISDFDTYWRQLTQNTMMDMRAVLNMLLPYINDNELDSKKSELINLSDIFTTKRDNKYYYTNSQYNRCVRTDNSIIERPFLIDYFTHHMYLLLMSIENVANKLYVNWVDIVPVPMNLYTQKQLYLSTIDKLAKGDEGINFYMQYIDTQAGLSYQEMYNVVCNQLFAEVKNIKWLIYDINSDQGPVSVITLLEERFDLSTVWNKRSWFQLNNLQREKFRIDCNNFLKRRGVVDNLLITHFYFFFQKYHINSKKLVEQGYLKLIGVLADDDEVEDIGPMDNDSINAMQIALANVPVEEFYLFFYNQLSDFKKTWYYYQIKIKGSHILKTENVSGQDVYLTTKNIYNYSKSITHYINDNLFTPMPDKWISLDSDMALIFSSRLSNLQTMRTEVSKTLDPINYQLFANGRTVWFNISKYISRLYFFGRSNPAIPIVNQWIGTEIRKIIVDIIFQSLIYHGLLSEFSPNEKITNNTYIESQINSKNDEEMKKFKYQMMKDTVFTSARRSDYEKNSYYFVTNELYGDLDPIRSKEYKKPYFDFLMSEQNWTFVYAMNWVSQINFYHHYINNRVIYVTGATGVGKSTEVPKLLFYSQKMIDYNPNGKIICTQPRIPPTEAVTDIVSKNMGVPINTYDEKFETNIPTVNYYLQYKHQKMSHINKQEKSFLRFVTDGTLYAEMKNYPFLTRLTSSTDNDWKNEYSSKNIYDIVIIDEAHEHNANMDMILTLARDACYVNNSLKLVIVSATMDDDEPIYRRYYRMINDNRMHPLNSFIQKNRIDRINMDRRIHISPPGKTTQYEIKKIYLSKEESSLVNDRNFVDMGIDLTVNVVNTTDSGDVLLFMSGQKDIVKSVQEINKRTPANTICLPYYSELNENAKAFIINIHNELKFLTTAKENVLEDMKEGGVAPGTYKRAVIVATNVAEASLTLKNLKYVVDTGYAKVMLYNPLTNTSEMKTLPISQSSSAQRTGRVGRVSSGTVYYLYDEEKISNNKTSYKIAEADVRDMLANLIKTEPFDYPIIDQVNDINDYTNIIKMSNTKFTPSREQIYLYKILFNPTAYLSIITSQYQTGILSAPYNYLGHFDPKIKISSRDYFTANHEDYDYYDEHSFTSRGFTGYDEYTLYDFETQFYIVHPDENIIERDPYTGAIRKIKYTPYVDNDYYHFLLSFNGININHDNTEKMIEFINRRGLANQLLLPKAVLAMNNNRALTIVFNVDADLILDRKPERVENPEIQELLIEYYNHINSSYSHPGLVLTKLSAKLQELPRIYDISSLRNWNTLLWFSYCLPSDHHEDVMMIELFIKYMPNIKAIAEPWGNRFGVTRYFNVNSDKQGDMSFIYTIISEIKTIMQTTKIYDLLKINDTDLSDFVELKRRYYENATMDVDEFLAIRHMDERGVLGDPHELYYYFKDLDVDADEYMTDRFKNLLQSLARRRYLDYDILEEFCAELIDSLYDIRKREWIYNYETEHGLKEEDSPKENMIDWIKQNLRVSTNTDITTSWDLILQNYTRAYVTNIIYNSGFSYYNIQTGEEIDTFPWSRNISKEATFLTNKSQYMIYHNSDIVGNESYVFLLTPIPLSSAIYANPLYYYLMFSKNRVGRGIISPEILVSDENSSVMKKIKDDIMMNMYKDRLLTYIDNFPDENIRSLRREIIKN